jgi:serine/threonine protein kinase
MTQPQPLTPPAPPSATPGSSGAPALQARTTVGGFETQRVIARSASTVVYLAADLALGMPVALQEYLPSRLVLRDARQGLKALSPANADAVARGRQAFIDESRMLVRCEHPALVRVLHLFEANGTAYRVMPYREGRRLLDVRREMAEPPDEAALRALLDALLGALDAIHRAGHVHGGVTPANILLLTDDSPLLLGPGAAGRALGHGIDAPPSAGLAMPFAPPAGPSLHDATGPWVDFYGLAQVIRFCISGRLPAAASTADPFPSLAEAIEQSFDPEVRTLYSPALLEAIEAASSPLATDRPESVAQFREWLGQGAVMTPTRSPAPPATQPDDRPRAPAPPDPKPRAAVPPPAVPPKPVVRTAPPRPAVMGSPPAAPLAADAFAKTRPMPRAQAPWNPAANATALRRRRLGWIVGALAVISALAIAAGVWRLLPAPRAGSAPAAVTEPAAAPVATTPLGPITPADGMAAASAPAELAAGPAVSPAALPLPDVPPAAAAPAPGSERPIASAPPAAAPAPALVPAAAGTAAAATAAKAAKAAAAAKTRAEAAAKARADAAAKRAAAPAPKRTSTTAAAAPAAAATAAGPRAVCAPRTEFALYRCMQIQCKSAKWSAHPQCQRLQKTDRVE